MSTHKETIEFIAKERKQVEICLAVDIEAAVRRFQENTGLAVTGVNVQMLNVTLVGQPRSYQVGRVRLDVDLSE